MNVQTISLIFNPSFTDKQALLKYTINASVQGRLYFYLDETWGYASAEQDCAKKITMAKFRIRPNGILISSLNDGPHL